MGMAVTQFPARCCCGINFYTDAALSLFYYNRYGLNGGSFDDRIQNVCADGIIKNCVSDEVSYSLTHLLIV